MSTVSQNSDIIHSNAGGNDIAPVKGAMGALRRVCYAVTLHLNCLLVVLAFLCALAFVVLLKLGVERELLQLIAFPPLLAIFYLLPIKKVDRLPIGLILAVFGLWAAATLHITGVLAGRILPESVYVGRFQGDEIGSQTRGFVDQFNRAAENFGGVRTSTLYRPPVGYSDANAWLGDRENVLLLLLGRDSWFEAISTPAPIFKSEVASYYQALAESYGITPGSRTKAIVLPGTDSPFLLVMMPERLNLPVNPIEQVARVLSPISLGLKGLANDEQNAAAWFDLGAAIEAHWPSSTPIGFARFLGATARIISGTAGGELQRRELLCAERSLRAALFKLQSKYHPELVAAIENNLALSTFLQAKTRREKKQVKKLLVRATARRNSEGEPVLAARAAMLNLLIMRRAGVIR